MLLARARRAMREAEGGGDAGRLGMILGELAKAGRDKATFVVSEGIASFGDWVEQLIAESTGKEGRGILPVVGEPVGGASVYGEDRVFVHVRMEGDATQDAALAALAEAGHPVITVDLADAYDLGGQFFVWELALAVAGARLGINPFDQPDVEAAKAQARKMTAAYQSEGKLPAHAPIMEEEGVRVYGEVAGEGPGEALAAFLGQAEAGGYVAVHAYVRPSAEMDGALEELRLAVRDRYRLATTVGYGPRFLHSTGQLHKGDGGKGLFIQLTRDSARDAAIPDEAGSAESSMTFGVLEAAQALGDRQALLDKGRRVIRFHLGADVAGGVRKLVHWLG